MVRAVKLRAGKSFIDRPVQFLYPLELKCNKPVTPQSTDLNAKAQEFRPKRRAFTDATNNVSETFQYEEENDF